MWLNIIPLQVVSLFGLRLSGNMYGTQIKTEQTLSRGYRFVLMVDFQELNIHLTTMGDFKCTGNTPNSDSEQNIFQNHFSQPKGKARIN